MPKYWLISDRDKGGVGQGMNNAGLTYWVSEGGDLTNIASWQKVTATNFQTLLAAAADQFPDDVPSEQQSHVTILVHGFKEWAERGSVLTFDTTRTNLQEGSELTFDTKPTVSHGIPSTAEITSDIGR
jgi:hypothetical protein